MSLTNLGLAIVEEEGKVGVEVVAILKTDELGKKLHYPSAVMYDQEMDETYVVAGGEGKVIIYGSNLFPTVALGKGRGADSPKGIYIDKSSTVYLCQSNSANKPARITTFNPAFFPEKEILFSSMPEAENFVPKNMVTGLSGNMYISGQNTRGLLVLDSEGNFSHWLKPMDKLITENSLIMSVEEGVEGLPKLVANTEAMQDTDQKESSITEMRELLPPNLQPAIKENGETFIDQELKPVQVAHVATDAEGHLYVLSEETSKIYVYSHTEELLFSFGQKGGSTGKMSRPKCLVVDEKKKALYVVDYMRHTILIFDLGGKFMYEFGGMGTGPGWFQYPIGLALNRAGNLIVADLFNQRVQILNVKFEYQFPTFQIPDEEAIPSEEELPTQDFKGEDGDTYFPKPIYL
ncbi:MAG: NHL repeat-containing protein [Proteobacteria bacterium]|nr:NHL repeat-containing protein [Pseudomonadota bacterium]